MKKKKIEPSPYINLNLQLPSHDLVLDLSKLSNTKVLELKNQLVAYCKHWGIKG